MPRAVLLEPNDGCLTIARTLAARGVEVVALCPPGSAWIGRSNAVREVVLPGLADGTDAWLQALTTLGDRPGVLIPGSDAASEFLAAHRPEVPEVLSAFEGPATAHRTLMDKAELYAIAARAGVRYPLTVRVDDLADLQEVERAGLSGGFVAKPVLGHAGRRKGPFTTRLVPDLDALSEHVGSALRVGIPMLVSEDVPGPTSALEGVITVLTAEGTVPLESGRRKLRGYDHGVGSLVESFDAPEAIALSRRLLEAAGYTGVAATEFKRHSGTGELHLIEVNVRVPQYFGVYEAAGTDASWRLYATLAGLELDRQPRGRSGVSVWMPQHDLHVVREMRRASPLPWSEVVGPLARVRDFGALSLRDRGPALSLARTELSRAVAGRRSARRPRAAGGPAPLVDGPPGGGCPQG